MPNRCSATKANGEPCTLFAHSERGLCWAHDPENREKRRANAYKGGKAKANQEIAHIKADLKQLAEDVRNEELDRAVGAVVSQVYNTYLKALETERRLTELGEVKERLDELEEIARRRYPAQSGPRYRGR